jgi:Cu/Ag efflux pump CusA
MKVVDAIRAGNNDVGGRVVEFSGTEYMVRGRGYAKSKDDLEQIVVGRDDHGTPILIKNIARVEIGPEMRRGLADLDGRGHRGGHCGDALRGKRPERDRPGESQIGRSENRRCPRGLRW